MRRVFVITVMRNGGLRKAARMLIMEFDDSSEEDEPKPTRRSKEKGEDSSRNEPKIVEVEPCISIHALSGSPNPRTMRLIGKMQ